MDSEVVVDPMRDTPIRFLGYANELGESFRPVLPRLVGPSYVMAFGYVLADVEHKRRQQVTAEKMASAAIDTLVWQTLASVFIPGLVINRVVWASSLAVESATLGKSARRWVPVTLGLAAIPWIIEPIDHGVDLVLDKVLRPYLVHDK